MICKLFVRTCILHFLAYVLGVSMMFWSAGAVFAAEPVELIFHHWGVTPSEGFEAYAKERGMDVKLIEEAVFSDVASFFDDLRQGQSDVSLNYTALLQADNQKLTKLLLPIEVERLENFKKIDPDVLTMAMDVIDGKRYGVPLQTAMHTILYNADRVTTPPDSWNVLWDPANQGLVSVFGKGEPEWVPGVALYVLGYPPDTAYDMDYDSSVNWDQVETKLVDLAKNCHEFYPSFMPEPENIRDTNYVLAKDFTVRWINQTGQNWQISRPKEAVQAWNDDLYLGRHLKDQPEKLKAAYLLIDYILTDKIQKQIYNNSGFAPATLSAKQQLLEEGNEDVRLQTGFYKGVELIKPFNSRTVNFYRQLWTKAVQEAGKTF